jgi:hypothetical protein
MPETINQRLVKPFTPLEKPKMTIPYEKMKFYKYELIGKTQLPFHLQGFVECWRISIGANLVFLTAKDTIDHFAHRSNQVGVHPLLFQLHGFKLNGIIDLKHKALSRSF